MYAPLVVYAESATYKLQLFALYQVPYQLVGALVLLLPPHLEVGHLRKDKRFLGISDQLTNNRVDCVLNLM